MHKTIQLLAMLALCLPIYAQSRDAARELAQGQAILAPRYNKDEAAFKAVANPSAKMKADEHILSLCFANARSTYHLYNQSENVADYMKPNCDSYFKPLEDDLENLGTSHSN